MQDTPDQYWKIRMYSLRCNGNFFFTLIFHTVKKTFEIVRNDFVIFRNPFYCRYKELIIFVIAYSFYTDFRIPFFFVPVTKILWK